MDEKTYAAMQLPRCGHHDQPMTENALSKRIRRYLLLGTIWHHMTLTYKITKFSKSCLSEVPEQLPGKLSTLVIDRSRNRDHIKSAYFLWGSGFKILIIKPNPQVHFQVIHSQVIHFDIMTIIVLSSGKEFLP